MLRMAHAMLRPNQYLFLAVRTLLEIYPSSAHTGLQLPLPCVMNSRYITPEHLQGLMQALAYTEVKQRWKKGGKMAYWLYRKCEPDLKFDDELTPYTKKTVVKLGNRNNFSILL